MSGHDTRPTPDDSDTEELLAQLRRDWEAMGAKTRTPLDEEGAAEDPTTLAATEWMRKAWERSLPSEAPPMPLALAAARRRARRAAAWRSRRRWLPAAAIAALVVAAGGLLGSGEDPANPAPAETAAKSTTESTEGHPGGGTTPPLATPLQAPAQLATPVPTFEPDGFSTRPDGVEILQGNVRIILIHGERVPAPSPTRR